MDEEKELLRKLKAGDLESFEKVLFHYEKAIFSYLYRLSASRAEAEDLTQEVFLKVYQKRKLIDPAQNFKSWLYTMATNAFYDRLRKKGRRPELFLEEENSFETISGDSTYLYIDRRKDIESALERLRPDYKTVIILFYREGFSYQEIGQMLSLSINTVKTYLRRAKESLRKYLGQDYK